MRIWFRDLTIWFDRCAVWCAAWGAMIVLVQMVWITYGVIVRYGFRSPDGVVTEATALLLFPVAFTGLALALKENAYPTVSILIDRFSPRWRSAATLVNMSLIVATSGFFAIASIRATIFSFQSRTTSIVLLWPRYWFWAQVALAFVILTTYSLLKLLDRIASASTKVN